MSATKPTTGSPISCRWYLCDDVRNEEGGKLSLLGLYPDDTVIINMPSDHPDPTPEAPIAVEELSIFCVLLGFQGEADFTLRLFDKKNPRVGLTRTLAIESSTSEGTINLISKFRPVAIHSFGEKRFSISCAAPKFQDDFVFRIIRRNIGAPLPHASVTLKGAIRPALTAPSSDPPVPKRVRKKSTPTSS